jgi:oligopeptide/dipeptide ABC transporter ATP-binding protein
VTHPLLQITDLGVGFETQSGFLPVIEGVGFEVFSGESVALVGESGCGKSVTAKAILDLLPSPPAKITSGEVLFDGVDLRTMSPRALREVRGRDIGFVFQNPMTALNPCYRVGEQIAERLRRFSGHGRRAAAIRAVSLLAEVGIPSPGERARAYPHELSGGMRQRVVIAIALACGPRLLIADEPTTALDVTIQAQLMSLLRAQQAARSMAVLLITHDLGLVAQYVDRVVVMYAGQIVETAPVQALFDRPRHPYTRGLLKAVPGVTAPDAQGRLWSIGGAVPAPQDFPTGCRFAPRCPRASDSCGGDPIPTVVEQHRTVRCLDPHDHGLELSAPRSA